MDRFKLSATDRAILSDLNEAINDLRVLQFAMPSTSQVTVSYLMTCTIEMLAVAVKISENIDGKTDSKLRDDQLQRLLTNAEAVFVAELAKLDADPEKFARAVKTGKELQALSALGVALMQKKPTE